VAASAPVRRALASIHAVIYACVHLTDLTVASTFSRLLLSYSAIILSLFRMRQGVSRVLFLCGSGSSYRERHDAEALQHLKAVSFYVLHMICG
jgi:hypothetical protein